MPVDRINQEELFIEEESPPAPHVINAKPQRRKRHMTPEMLEKLKKARELALVAKKQGAVIRAQHSEIKETFGQKINDVETFKKLKEKVDEEVKKNEIVAINQKLEDMHMKFNGFLQDREQRKLEKARRKEEKTAKEIARELPAAISQKMLDEELKKREIEYWRKRYFGV